MKTLLILARGDGRTFYTLEKKSILENLPFNSVLLVDRGNCNEFDGLPGLFATEIVRWGEPLQLRQKVAELHLKHQFDAVVTLDESNVVLAAELREQLGLPGMKAEQANWFRDKVLMKQQLQPAGIRVPQFVACKDQEQVVELFKRYGKLVIKPIDGFGSKQVAIISHRQELDAWFVENATQAQHYEAEEYINGQLYHVNALVVDGVARITAAATYIPGMSNIDFSLGTPFVSVMLEDGELKNRLVDFSEQINSALQLKNGVTHLECFVTPENEIVFCEIGLRPGGGGIVWMVESQFGVNYNQAAIVLEAGMSELLPQPVSKPSSIAGLIGIRTNLSGFVEQCADESDYSDANIQLKQIDVKPGSFQAASAHCTDFMSLFIFESENSQEFESYWRKLYQSFQEKLVLNCI